MDKSLWQQESSLHVCTKATANKRDIIIFSTCWWKLHNHILRMGKAVYIFPVKTYKWYKLLGLNIQFSGRIYPRPELGMIHGCFRTTSPSLFHSVHSMHVVICLQEGTFPFGLYLYAKNCACHFFSVYCFVCTVLWAQNIQYSTWEMGFNSLHFDLLIPWMVPLNRSYNLHNKTALMGRHLSYQYCSLHLKPNKWKLSGFIGQILKASLKSVLPLTVPWAYASIHSTILSKFSESLESGKWFLVLFFGDGGARVYLACIATRTAVTQPPPSLYPPTWTHPENIGFGAAWHWTVIGWSLHVLAACVFGRTVCTLETSCNDTRARQ